MAKGYSARKGFSGGAGMMQQQAQMQQKLMKMQQEMSKAQEEVENSSFTASVGGGAVTAAVSGKKELTALTIKPDVVDPEDLIRLHCICRSGFSVRQEICVRAEALRSWQQHLWKREARWTMLFMKNLREPVTWSWCWIENFRRRECSRRSIFRNPEPEEKICCLIKKSRMQFISSERQ